MSMDPKIQDLVEEYFKRPLTPEEGLRLSQWLSQSPEETQRFAQRLEVLNSQASAPGASHEIPLKDLPVPAKDPSWAKIAFWILLPLMGLFLYWRLTSPLTPEVPSRSTPSAKEPAPSQGPVKVFQSRKSLPPPQISTPIPFKDDQKPKSQEIPSRP